MFKFAENVELHVQILGVKKVKKNKYKNNFKWAHHSLTDEIQR